MILSLEEFIETSSTNSCEEKSTPIISLERKVSCVEWSSEDSTSNEITTSKIKYEGEVSSSVILEKINEKEVSTSNIFTYSTSRRNLEEITFGITFKESSTKEEYEFCLKASYEEDDHELTKLSYEQLFKLNTKLIQVNDKINKCVIPQNFPYFFHFFFWLWLSLHLHAHNHLGHSFIIAFSK